MSPRSFPHAPSLDVPPVADSKTSTNAAPPITDARTPATTPSDTALGEASETADTEAAPDIVASCEDNGTSSPSGTGEPASTPNSDKTVVPSPAVQAAIDRCLAVRKLSGSFIGWGERSEETAAAALDAVALMEKDYAAVKAVRKPLNDERKKLGERALNKSTSKELLAVFLCAAPKTKAERQECSRFANVIVVAKAEKRTSENVGAWLKATTLTKVLEKAALLKGKPSYKTYSVAITRTKYPLLWERFSTKKARDAIEKALIDLNNSLRKEARNAR